MNCFDCALSEKTTPAIGTCTTCGAGVCAADVALDIHELSYATSPGNHTPRMTRAITCKNCAGILAGTHPLLAQPAQL